MKILAIASSPRRNGNSETLLDVVVSSVNAKAKKIVLTNLNIAPCNGCQACLKTGECVIKDDMQALYRDLLSADVLLIASPIYFKGLPCQLKCVIDRCQALWARKYVLKKLLAKGKSKRTATAILVSASSGVKDIRLRQGYGGLSPEALAKGDMFLGAIITLKAWFKTLDFGYKKEFLAQGLEGRNDALKDKKLLKKIDIFGKDLIR